MFCETCGKKIPHDRFHPKRARRFCSLNCRWGKGRPEVSGDNSHFWKGGKKEYKCDFCGKRFKDYESNIKLYKNKFCSRRCLGKWTYQEKNNLIIFEKNHTPWNKGKKCYYQRGENNNNWKGDNVSYFGLHSWLKRHKFRPKECEFCKKEGKRIEFANISGNYLRDVDDYFSLCTSCHIKFDRYKLSHGVGLSGFNFD